MSLLNLLNVGVGLVLIWLVVSLVVMQMQEWLAGRRQLRPKMLAATIENMLGALLARQFYAHPIIQSLSAKKDGTALPSYIPSQQFAAVVLDLIQSLGDEAAFLYQQILSLCSSLEGRKQSKARKAALPRLRTLLSLLGNAREGKDRRGHTAQDLEWAFAQLQKIAADFPPVAPDLQVLEESYRTVMESKVAAPTGSSSAEGLIQKTRAGLAALSSLDPGLGKSLRVIFSALDEFVNQPENGLSLSRQSLQNWFDSAMERLNGRYKRHAVLLSFAIGFCLAVAINIDTVLLAGFLWRQAYVADALAREAQSLLSSVSNDSSQLSAVGQLALFQSRFAVYNVPVGWIGLPIAPGASVSLQALGQACSLAAKGPGAIHGLMLANQCFPVVNAPGVSDYLGWLVKFLGCVITAAAAAQGAPFWFDVLAKLINVRSSGVKPSAAADRVG